MAYVCLLQKVKILHCRERGREVRSTLEDFGHADQLNLEFCSR